MPASLHCSVSLAEPHKTGINAAAVRKAVNYENS